MQPILVDKSSFIVSAIVFVGAFAVIFNDTKEFGGSLFAAILTAALTWVAYVLVRWLVLALKK